MPGDDEEEENIIMINSVAQSSYMKIRPFSLVLIQIFLCFFFVLFCFVLFLLFKVAYRRLSINLDAFVKAGFALRITNWSIP